MAELYNVREGKLVEYELTVDNNGEIVATYGDDFLKFPAGLTKTQLVKLFKEHNEANDGVVAITDEEAWEQGKEARASQKLIDSL